MADETSAMVNALRGMSPEDQAAMQPETFANPLLAPPSHEAISNFFNMQRPDHSSEHVKFPTSNPMTSITDEDIGRGMDVVGSAGTGTIAGRGAKGLDKKALLEAQLMVGAGKHPNDVWRDTGFGVDPVNNRWMFEIPDKNLQVMHTEATGPADVILNHPDLFNRNYPDLGKIKTTTSLDDQMSGMYHPPDYHSEPNRLWINGPTPGQMRVAGAHELQHAVQSAEGWSPGGSVDDMTNYLNAWRNNPKEGNPFSTTPQSHLSDFANYRDPGYESYRRLAGEVQAYNTEHRLRMTDNARRNVPPWATQDVPYAKQLKIVPNQWNIEALKPPEWYKEPAAVQYMRALMGDYK